MYENILHFAMPDMRIIRSTNMANKFEFQSLKSPSGAKLAIYFMPASKNTNSPAKGIIQINHGMAEHAKRYERFAAKLSKAGYHVYAHDHRGHGKTQAPDARLGIFAQRNGFTKVISDVEAVHEHIKTNHPKLPVAVLGHSMGSVITQNFLIKNSDTVSAALLLNTGAEGGPLLALFRTIIKIAIALKGSDVPALLAERLTFADWNKKFAPNRTNLDWLSRDEAEVDKYIKDPLCGFTVSNGLWRDVTDGIKISASNSNLSKIRNDLPLYLIGGAADPCTENGKHMKNLHDRFIATGNQNTTLSILPDTRHESLNEINREEVTKDIIQWLDKNLT